MAIVLKILTLSAVFAATSTAAVSGNMNEAEAVVAQPDDGVFEEQSTDRPAFLIPVLACAILCTTLLLNASDDEGAGTGITGSTAGTGD